MTAAWTLTLLVLVMAFGALVMYQQSETRSGRIVTGATAMILGVPGLIILVLLVV